MGVDGMMRGVASQKLNVDGCDTCGNEGENVELSSVSYLTVPADDRRPSTADLVIEKLKVEKVEGGGLSIQGVALASHCHITLCVFGTFFLVAGLILSYISFNVSAISEQHHEELGPINEEENITSTTNKPAEQIVTSVTEMRRIGPSFIAVGLVMLILGVAFFALVKKISRDEKAHRLIISEHQLNQLASSFSHANANTSPMHTIAPAPHEQYPILSVRRNSWWVDPTPVESNTNPDACDFAMQCPSPLGDNHGIISPPPISPVPSETRADRRDSYADIACFPAPAPSAEKISPEAAAPGGQNQDTAEQGQGQGHPASANTLHGRSFPAPVPSDNHPSSATHIPHIQVTSAHYSTSVPRLPRLSRHCLDSRPTTADSR